MSGDRSARRFDSGTAGAVPASAPAGWAPSRREVLEALRGRLVDALDATHKPECECECGPPGDARLLAALAKELRAVVAELEALPAPEGKTVSGDLRERVAGVLSGPA